MGWTFTHRDKGLTNRAWFEKEVVGTGPEFKRTVLADATIGGTYYAAVREDETGEVWALVCLTRWVPRDYHNYGWKSMDERMGPNEAQAPAKVLDLLTPTDSEYALAWRERCRAHLARKAAAAKVRKGDLVRFAQPIEFADDAVHTELEFIERNTFRVTGHGRYRIPGWRTRSYEVVTG